jgi:hypothetical protein
MGLSVEQVEKVQAEVVIDAAGDSEVIQGWYVEAGAVRTSEALQKLLDRLTGDFKVMGEATPHAHAAIALAALKISFNSKLGDMDSDQRRTFLDLIGSALGLV